MLHGSHFKETLQYHSPFTIQVLTMTDQISKKKRKRSRDVQKKAGDDGAVGEDQLPDGKSSVVADETSATPSPSKKTKKHKKKKNKKSVDSKHGGLDNGGGNPEPSEDVNVDEKMAPNKNSISDDDKNQIEQPEEEQSETRKDGHNSNEEDDDDDDDELMHAAAAWAEQQEEQASPSAPSSVIESLSLHVTQLPFDANDLDIRKLFAEKGCVATSIRLVYDRDEQGRKTVSRGVCFVDVADAKSYKIALEMHRKCSIRGRKLNIRPTRSREELSDIVSRTRDAVKEKIRQQLEGGLGVKPDVAGIPGKKKNNTDAASAEKKRRNKEKKKEKKQNSKRKQDGEKAPVKRGKLTKKERNRRAAIIMQKKRAACRK